MAANWQQIPAIVKLLVILGAVNLTNYFGWKLKFEPGNQPKMGAALLLLGSLFYGAAIWLVAQIFNLEVNFSGGILLWALGTLATALATSTLPLGCLAAILGGMWLFANYTWDARQFLPFVPSLIAYLGTALALAFHMKSRAVTWITLVFSGVWMLSILGAFNAVPLLLFGLSVVGAYFFVREKQPLLEQPFLYVGEISTLASLLIATVSNFRSAEYIRMADLGTLLAICLTILGVVAWRVPKFKEEMIVCAGLALVCSLVLGSAPEHSRLIGNVALLAGIGAFIYTGLMRIQSAGMVNVALVFFVIDIIARYFDVFYTLMNRSFFFVVGGVLLMVVGAITERGRRTILEGMHS
ncbi:MAG TPA: DUF2157 domain-containing protein [Candidatus Obscuribacterales bacterium]|nr:DUF2157 domain-containing protein [Candidatus Obscuribacterales bacterium]